jgi:hypothetical protein
LTGAAFEKGVGLTLFLGIRRKAGGASGTLRGPSLLMMVLLLYLFVLLLLMFMVELFLFLLSLSFLAM